MERNKDWSFRVLYTSDRHLDSEESDRALQREHMRQAAAIGAPILDGGDLIDGMQLKHDKRQNKDDLRLENKKLLYSDSLIEQSSKFLAPWAKLFAVMLSGNHEHTFAEHCGTSLSNWIVRELREYGSNVYHAGYSASVAFSFVDGRKRRSVNLWMEHGAGSSSSQSGNLASLVTKMTYLPDFNIVVSGHNHSQAFCPIQRLRRSPFGKLYEDTVLLLKAPSYKREYNSGREGWWARGGRGPRPCGAWWLEFGWNPATHSIVYKAIPA